MPPVVEKLLKGEAEGNGRKGIELAKRATRSLFPLFGVHRVRKGGDPLALPAIYRQT